MTNKNSVVLGKVAKYNNVQPMPEQDKLLLEIPKDDLQILEAINLTHHIDKVKKTFNEENKVVQLKQIFGKNVYLGSDIKKLCIMYDLKCPKAEYFKGNVGSEIAQVIRDFINDNTVIETIEIPVKRYFWNENGAKDWEYTGEKEIEEKKICNINTGASNFFILSTAESFMKDDAKAMNATLFYREHSNRTTISEDDHLIELHSWGNNYSNKRMFNSLLHIQDHGTYNMYGDKTSDSSDELTIASFFYISCFVMLLMSIIGSIFNLMGLVYVNAFIATIFLINLALVSSELKHFKSWNQNKY